MGTDNKGDVIGWDDRTDEERDAARYGNANTAQKIAIDQGKLTREEVDGKPPVETSPTSAAVPSWDDRTDEERDAARYGNANTAQKIAIDQGKLTREEADASRG